MTVYRVAAEFTPDLGGRYRSDGDFSGEQFREDELLPKFDQAIKDARVLIINFDGVTGMPTSFLEEAFGGLVRSRRAVPYATIDRTLRLEAPQSPRLWHYIRFAEDAMRRAAIRSR